MVKVTGIVLLLALVSCNKSNSNNPSNSLNDTALSGAFSSGCVNDSKRSYIDTFSFEGPKVEVEVTNFDGADCNKQKKLESFVSTYSYSLDGQTVEFTKGNYFYTYFNNELTQNYNEKSGFCEIIDWQRSETRDITGKNCDGKSFITGDRFLVNLKKTSEQKLLINGNDYIRIDKSLL